MVLREIIENLDFTLYLIVIFPLRYEAGRDHWSRRRQAMNASVSDLKRCRVRAKLHVQIGASEGARIAGGSTQMEPLSHMRGRAAPSRLWVKGCCDQHPSCLSGLPSPADMALATAAACRRRVRFCPDTMHEKLRTRPAAMGQERSFRTNLICVRRVFR